MLLEELLPEELLLEELLVDVLEVDELELLVEPPELGLLGAGLLPQATNPRLKNSANSQNNLAERGLVGKVARCSEIVMSIRP